MPCARSRRVCPPGVLLQARRSAALMLDSEALIGRLHRYVVGGEDADALRFKAPGTTDRSCKPVRVLDTLVEGVKAGVAMPYDRVLEDFWLAGKSECAAAKGVRRGRGAPGALGAARKVGSWDGGMGWGHGDSWLAAKRERGRVLGKGKGNNRSEHKGSGGWWSDGMRGSTWGNEGEEWNAAAVAKIEAVNEPCASCRPQSWPCAVHTHQQTPVGARRPRPPSAQAPAYPITRSSVTPTCTHRPSSAIATTAIDLPLFALPLHALSAIPVCQQLYQAYYAYIPHRTRYTTSIIHRHPCHPADKGLDLDALMEMTITVASTAAEPGSGVFLSTMHNKLYSHKETFPAVKEQVRRAGGRPGAWGGARAGPLYCTGCRSYGALMW